MNGTNKVNCTIPLAETQVQVLDESGGDWGDFPAKVSMRLSSSPQVFIEITTPPMTGVVHGWIFQGGNSPTRIRLSSTDDPIEALVVKGAVGPLGLLVRRVLLVPTRQPVTAIQTGETLQSVRFNVINFPSLYDNMCPVRLLAEPWCIEIKAIPELSKIRNVLDEESGYGITHECSIQRSDGKSFSVEEASKTLNVLHLFLSFARGGNCGVTLITGSDEKGRRAWEQWGTYSTYPWFRLSSWLDHRYTNNDALSKAFPGFWRIVGQKTDAPDDPVRVALYWYLRSNESDVLQAGIILTQAALERLARQLLPNEKYETLKNTAERIHAVLEETGIGPAIPQSCKELREVAQVDGPEILTKIRNDLVHAEMRTNVSLEAYLEARDLGQWYVELLLLRLFEYEGQYANRLAYKYEGIWKPEVVPWVRGIKDTG